jgi:integrase
MSRAYRNVRPKANMVYSVADVEALYSICRNTVSNWVSGGLHPSDSHSPQIFRGAELIRFHTERRKRGSLSLRKGEFKCLACKAAVFPMVETMALHLVRSGARMACARCPDCDAVVTKLLDETECNSIQNSIDHNTSMGPSDEEDGSTLGGVGKNRGAAQRDWHSANDRIINQWLLYAGRYDAKTVAAHLTSIRDFESYLEGKPFEQVRTHDAGGYRDAISAKGQLQKHKGGSSRSTIRHRASHLIAFFSWLRKQDGYKRLSADIPEYFLLSRRASALALSPDPKPFPTIDEAIELAKVMPATSLLARRDRAIFSLAFVSGFRAGALISLRIRHLDPTLKHVEQNAAEVRAKNSKSFTANWFPRTEALQEIVLAWLKELATNGFRTDDALFPAAEHLQCSRAKLSAQDRPSIPPMRSNAGVNHAFAMASKRSANDYSPHSARHCLAALGEKLCNSPEARKAWSLNLGHANEATTQVHYAKLTNKQLDEVFQSLHQTDLLMDEEKDLMLAYHEHKLVPGTPEFIHARKMVTKRVMAEG